jgi:hypothetical protein
MLKGNELVKAPRPFKLDKRRLNSYSLCIACGKWKSSNNIFHHEGRHWILCQIDYFDYWENTDALLPDYKGYL